MNLSTHSQTFLYVTSTSHVFMCISDLLFRETGRWALRRHVRVFSSVRVLRYKRRKKRVAWNRKSKWKRRKSWKMFSWLWAAEEGTEICGRYLHNITNMHITNHMTSQPHYFFGNGPHNIIIHQIHAQKGNPTVSSRYSQSLGKIILCYTSWLYAETSAGLGTALFKQTWSYNQMSFLAWKKCESIERTFNRTKYCFWPKNHSTFSCFTFFDCLKKKILPTVPR